MAFENITLEKGMYGVPGKSFTQVLEELDGSQNYTGTPLAGLDAYQRQLKRFGIRVSGPSCDTVEKFFTSSQSAALFPEYVARAVRQGMEMANHLPDMVATVTKIDTLDYRTIQAETAESEKIADPVAEGSAIPQTVVKTGSALVTLKKRGRMIVSSYEALRHHRLDLFTVILRQIGVYIARRQMKDAVDVLLNGDGSNGGITVTALSAAPTYSDLVTLWGKLADYHFNTILAGTTALQDLLKISEFKDAQAGLNISGAGKLITPLGATLIHVPSMDAKKLIALDRNCALEMVQAGDVLTDYDKLIDRQMERAAITAVAGFAQIYGDAAQGLSY
ncbi:MAG: phage major capsid protein [Hominenteromicrobium sp.]